MRIFETVRTVVVKVGSSVLTRPDGSLSRSDLKRIISEIIGLKQRGLGLVLVSSGAIASGLHAVGHKKRPREISELQACAAVGQPLLMQAYQSLLPRQKVAQILITRDDIEDRRRFLNAKHTLKSLLSHGVLPIVNENDTVAVDEIKVGDNDSLAAFIATLVEADLLILLTDRDGFYRRDPAVDPTAERIPLVRDIDALQAEAGGTSRRLTGVGGMQTKLQAARIAGKCGIPTLIANGRRKRHLQMIFNTGDLEKRGGTLFLPKT